ncbi:MAG TPA: hypothetical protein VJP77_09635 [Planctomycetota bacterium]|nr:hypothetical protein [Planctomycetota bacterium]
MPVSPLRCAAAALAFSAAFVALPADAVAQCGGPDNLDSAACWTPVPANIPALPGFFLPATTICWSGCNPVQLCAGLSVQPPVPSATCGQFDAQVDVVDCGGLVSMTGKLHLDYTRTWDEVHPSGSVHQIYRFVAKVELAPPGPGTFACPMPTCLNTHPTAFYYGYVDWSFECGTILYENAAVLYHPCDRFVHAPGVSAQPGIFHPGDSYAVVAPDAPTNPFVALPITPPNGLLTAEAFRTASAPGGSCVVEEPVFGQILPFFQACTCPLSLAPQRDYLQFLAGTGTCPGLNGPSAFQTLNLFPAFPWFHLMSTSIGRWTNPLAYPGAEGAAVSEGVLQVYDSTVAAGFLEIYYGAQTVDGWTVLPPASGVNLTQKFIDLADNYTLNATATPTPPFVGNVLPTDRLIYVNAP